MNLCIIHIPNIEILFDFQDPYKHFDIKKLEFHPQKQLIAPLSQKKTASNIHHDHGKSIFIINVLFKAYFALIEYCAFFQLVAFQIRFLCAISIKFLFESLLEIIRTPFKNTRDICKAKNL